MFPLAVTSSAFSNSPELVQKLRSAGFDDLRLNSTGARLPTQELIDFLSDREGVILGMDSIGEPILAHCPSIRTIAKFGVGIDNVDLEACEERGVRVAWTPGVNRTSVAEQTLAFMISLCRNLHSASRALRAGAWIKDGGSQLSGKTVGVIGVGNVGKELIRLLEPFRCRVLANDILDQSEYYRRHGLIESTKQQLFLEADVVTLHAPLTEETRNLLNRDVLQAMKKTAVLVNTARGEIVVEKDLKWALQSGAIAGAAIDVYSQEPPSDLEFLAQTNLICTPHIGGNAREAVLAMGDAAIEHILHYALTRGAA